MVVRLLLCCNGRSPPGRPGQDEAPAPLSRPGAPSTTYYYASARALALTPLRFSLARCVGRAGVRPAAGVGVARVRRRAAVRAGVRRRRRIARHDGRADLVRIEPDADRDRVAGAPRHV